MSDIPSFELTRVQLAKIPMAEGCDAAVQLSNPHHYTRYKGGTGQWLIYEKATGRWFVAEVREQGAE